MYHYLFTNDLRISKLDDSIKKAANLILNNAVPDSNTNKSLNNNINTLSFYFNLTQNSICSKVAERGDIKSIVLNFIKKFQFPNPRTTESFNNCITDGIILAPMRVIVKTLYFLTLLYPSDDAYLTQEEIRNFVFYNSEVAKKKNPDILSLISQILQYRKTNSFPSSISLDKKEREWKQEDRQIREMLKVLLWAGCVKIENIQYKLCIDGLSNTNKAAIFDIINYNEYWNGGTQSSYSEYMDLEKELLAEMNAEEKALFIPLLDIADDNDKEKKLGQIIKDKYTSNRDNTKMAEFHLFALQYAKAINDYNLDFRKILDEADLNNSFNSEFIKMNGLYKLCIKLGYVSHEDDVVTNDPFACDTSSYNVFGMHIKNRNDALSENNPHVCIGWSKLGDPSLYKTKEELKEAYSYKYGGTSQSIGQGVGEVLRFAKEMKQGDIVLFAENSFLHIGRIVSDLIWIEDPGQNQDEDYKNNREIEWIKKNIYRKNLPSELNYSLNAQMSIWRLNDYKDIVNRLIDDSYLPSDEYGEQDNGMQYTSDSLPIIESKGDEIKDINRIVYGAPGTGKTYSTTRIALEIIYKNNPQQLDRLMTLNRYNLMKEYQGFVYSKQIAFVTFHQSYGYEEFVQGIRPIPNSDSVSFENCDGVFKSMSQRALSDPSNNYVLIIDEINRGNISKIFGELITLIEPDKRWGEINQLSITLPSGDIFVVPNNLYIVGTMNSADKSISLIDAALRRRFIFIEQYPDETLIENEVLRTVFGRLNNSLADILNGTDLLIGHSYFMRKKEEDLCGIMNESVIPLLYEYFYDSKNKVIETVKEAIKELDYSIQDNNIGRIKIKKG